MASGRQRPRQLPALPPTTSPTIRAALQRQPHRPEARPPVQSAPRIPQCPVIRASHKVGATTVPIQPQGTIIPLIHWATIMPIRKPVFPTLHHRLQTTGEGWLLQQWSPRHFPMTATIQSETTAPPNLSHPVLTHHQWYGVPPRPPCFLQVR